MAQRAGGPMDAADWTPQRKQIRSTIPSAVLRGCGHVAGAPTRDEGAGWRDANPLALYHSDGEYYGAVIANAADDPSGMAESWATVAVRHLNTCNLIVQSCTTLSAL